MRLAVLISLGIFVLGAGVWLVLKDETAAAIPLLLTVPLAALRIARGGACGMRCGRRRGCSGDSSFFA